MLKLLEYISATLGDVSYIVRDPSPVVPAHPYEIDPLTLNSTRSYAAITNSLLSRYKAPWHIDPSARNSIAGLWASSLLPVSACIINVQSPSSPLDKI